jgi:hypothetical protein
MALIEKEIKLITCKNSELTMAIKKLGHSSQNKVPAAAMIILTLCTLYTKN